MDTMRSPSGSPAVSIGGGREVHLNRGVGVQGMGGSFVRGGLIGADEPSVGARTVMRLGGECCTQLLMHMTDFARTRCGDAIRNLLCEGAGSAGPGVQEPHQVVGILAFGARRVPRPWLRGNQLDQSRESRSRSDPLRRGGRRYVAQSVCLP